MTGRKKAAPQNATGLRTAAQWKAAVRRLNEIANQKAEAHNMCSVWDDIVEEVARETGLPLKGRSEQWDVTLNGNVTVSGDEPDLDDLQTRITNALVVAGGFEDVEVDLSSWDITRRER